MMVGCKWYNPKDVVSIDPLSDALQSLTDLLSRVEDDDKLTEIQSIKSFAAMKELQRVLSPRLKNSSSRLDNVSDRLQTVEKDNSEKRSIDLASIMKKAEEYIAADVIIIFATRRGNQNQISDESNEYEAFELPSATLRSLGTFTSTLLKILKEHDCVNMTNQEMLDKFSTFLSAKGSKQFPCLASSRPDAMDKTFRVVPGYFTGVKRALVIGILYKGHKGQLYASHHDVDNVLRYLKKIEGFRGRNINVLMDDGKNIEPTRKNIMNAMKNLVTMSEPGDVVFCYFAGHGGKYKNDCSEETHNEHDEAILPVDVIEAGPIRDDDLFRVLVCPMPKTVAMTCILDCSKAGNVLDLPFQFSSTGVDDDDVSTTLSNKVDFAHMIESRKIRRSIENNKFWKSLEGKESTEVIQLLSEEAEEYIPAKVHLFAACEGSLMTNNVCGSRVRTCSAIPEIEQNYTGTGGAFTLAMIEAFSFVEDYPKMTNRDVLIKMKATLNAIMTNRDVLIQMKASLSGMALDQNPHFCSSRLDIDDTFRLVPKGRKGICRAVLIGIAYDEKQKDSLGSHRDVDRVAEYLKKFHAFKEENIIRLMDDRRHTAPTGKNILQAFKNLALESKAQDVAFVYISGECGHLVDEYRDEDNGLDQTLVPIDMKEYGKIRDDTLFHKLVCPMPEDVALTCVFDCSYSSTILDLPFSFNLDDDPEELIENKVNCFPHMTYLHSERKIDRMYMRDFSPLKQHNEVKCIVDKSLHGDSEGVITNNSIILSVKNIEHNKASSSLHDLGETEHLKTESIEVHIPEDITMLAKNSENKSINIDSESSITKGLIRLSQTEKQELEKLTMVADSDDESIDEDNEVSIRRNLINLSEKEDEDSNASSSLDDSCEKEELEKVIEKTEVQIPEDILMLANSDDKSLNEDSEGSITNGLIHVSKKNDEHNNSTLSLYELEGKEKLEELNEKAEVYIPAHITMIAYSDEEALASNNNDEKSYSTKFQLPKSSSRTENAFTSTILNILKMKKQNDSMTYYDVFSKLLSALAHIGYRPSPILTSSRPDILQKTFDIASVSYSGSRRTYRALLIGINYKGQIGELDSCHDDVNDVLGYLKEGEGFLDENITILTDDGIHNSPSSKHIKSAFKHLARISEAGDSVFFFFCGHGMKILDADEDEVGYKQAIIPVDFLRTGPITDNEIFKLLVCPMPKDVTMTCIFDCSFSDTVLNLPFKFSPKDLLTDNDSIAVAKSGDFSHDRDAKEGRDGRKNIDKFWSKMRDLEIDEAIDFLSIEAKKYVKADVRLFSRCEDGQIAEEVEDSSGYFHIPEGAESGVFTDAFIESSIEIKSKPGSTPAHVMAKISKRLSDNNLKRIPAFSCSRIMGIDSKFHIVPDDCNGTCRAIMIGINYTHNPRSRLFGSHNDVKRMARFLKEFYGFDEENINMLLDDDTSIEPTRKNIIWAFKKLVSESEAGDVAFVFFSGHGGQIEDTDGDEDDGYDETLIPVDVLQNGPITDDTIFKVLVCTMQKGVTVTCVFDCCNSKTILDLPFTFLPTDTVSDILKRKPDFFPHMEYVKLLKIIDEPEYDAANSTMYEPANGSNELGVDNSTCKKESGETCEALQKTKIINSRKQRNDGSSKDSVLVPATKINHHFYNDTDVKSTSPKEMIRRESRGFISSAKGQGEFAMSLGKTLDQFAETIDSILEDIE